MSCEEFQARYLAGDLSPGQRNHLAACDSCRAAVPGLDRLADQLGDPLLWESPPRVLVDRVVAAVGAEAHPPPVPSRRTWAMAAAAAVAVVVIATGLWVAAARPDWEVHLAAGPDSPAAGGKVLGWNTDAGTRMKVVVSGLAEVDETAYYEIWLTSADGRHVSAGTFRGSGQVDAWAGVSRRNFPRIWITLEPADADPAPSWVVVLDTPAR